MSLKKYLFESEIQKLGLPSEMEAVITDLHDAAFPGSDDTTEFVEKDWKSVVKPVNKDPNEETLNTDEESLVETT